VAAVTLERTVNFFNGFTLSTETFSPLSNDP